MRQESRYSLKDIINRWTVVTGVQRLKLYDFDAIHINGIDNLVGAAIAKKLTFP